MCLGVFEEFFLEEVPLSGIVLLVRAADEIKTLFVDSRRSLIEFLDGGESHSSCSLDR